MKSGEGVRSILHDDAFGFHSQRKEGRAAGSEKRFDGIPHFSSFDESGTHVTLTKKIVTVRLGY